ncbi:MAG: AbrB/MazE/SpoVT family DNA-binding domain-containing protein, partial [archaeon]
HFCGSLLYAKSNFIVQLVMLFAISSNGRVVIPRKFMEELNWKGGQSLRSKKFQAVFLCLKPHKISFDQTPENSLLRLVMGILYILAPF